MRNLFSDTRYIRWLSFIDRPASAAPLALFVALAILAGFALFGHGCTIAAIFVNDMFVFFDGIDRLAQGQVPHVDFSTPAGALSYYLPYLGYSVLGQTFGGAVELASVLIGAVVLVITAGLLWKRASLVVSLLLLAGIAGIIFVPIVPGWKPPDISHAMHYNRWSWGLLTALFVLGLRPQGRGLSIWLVVASAATLLIALFFIKVSYFAVGFAFLGVLALFPDRRRWEAIYTALATVFGLVVIWLVLPGLLAGYLDDILLALRSNTEAGGNYLGIVKSNGTDFLLLALAFGVSFLQRDLGWRDYLLFFFIVGSGVAILSQNFQFVFIVTLLSGFAILAANSHNDGVSGQIARVLILGLALLFLAPYGKQWARAGIRFLDPAQSDQFVQLNDPRFETVFVANRLHYRRRPIAAVDNSGKNATEILAGDWQTSDLTEIDYVDALNEAIELGKTFQLQDQSVFTLDFTNAVPLLVGAKRISGGYSWIHLGRNVSEDTLLPAAQMFQDIEYVLVPFGALTAQKSKELRMVYGPYLAERARLVAQTKHWALFAAR